MAWSSGSRAWLIVIGACASFACSSSDRDAPAQTSEADGSVVRAQDRNMSGPDPGNAGSKAKPPSSGNGGAPSGGASDGGDDRTSAEAGTAADGSTAEPNPTEDAGAQENPADASEPAIDAGPRPCVPECTGKVCGDDGCGGSCGHCADHFSCSASGDRCSCQPQCAGRACGSDGCGGSCGSCSTPMVCDTTAGTCAASCSRDCTGKECGDDGCDGSCGDCNDGESCTASGQCVCAAQCEGRACGDDGCSGSCGPCASDQHCTTAGQCECTPDCTGRMCGGNGCGGTCGSGCSTGNICTTAGACRVPTFAADVYPIFTRAGVGCPGCHDTTPPAKLDLSSASRAYMQLVGADASQCTPIRKRVTAGDPNASYLINKLTGTMMCSGSRMPRGRAALGTTDMNTIRAWISGGATP